MIQRLYHFLRRSDALDDLRHQWLKVSEFNDLNDPFELLGVELSIPANRLIFKSAEERVAKRTGVLCFSQCSRNALLWSHYAEKHKGMCLGFDVEAHLLTPITYATERLLLEEDGLHSDEDFEQFVQQLMFTNFNGWSYEEEVRVSVPLNQRDNHDKLFIRRFGDGIELKEVIVGHRCDCQRQELQDAITGLTGVKIEKARLAFKSFEVVNRKGGLRTTRHSR